MLLKGSQACHYKSVGGRVSPKRLR